MKRIACILLVLGINVLLGQNLVPNNSFETYSSCPNAYSQLTRATNWTLVTSHTGTSDYFNTCGTSPVNTTTAFWGPQAPNSGNGYIGVLAWHSSLPSGREYAQTILTSPLVAGQNYTVSMMVSLGEICNYGCALQIYFSNTPYVMAPAGSTAITAVTPQVAFTTVGLNKTGWTLLTYTYTAVGGEQYLILGNFRNDATTVLVPAAAGTNNQTYYYVDDVVVTPTSPLPVALVDFNVSCINNYVQVDWATSSEVNNDYFMVEYSNDGIVYSEGMRINGGGNSNTMLHYSTNLFGGSGYYRLKQIDFDGNETSYTPQYVECAGDIPCPMVSLGQDDFIIKGFNTTDEMVEVVVMNVHGAVVSRDLYTIQHGQHIIHVPATHIASGLYLVSVSGVNYHCAQKILIQE